MPQLAYNENEDVCASCGEFVAQLNELTGWCDPCSGITPSTHCRRCNQPLGVNNGLCNQCKYLVWLETNADAIDNTMAERNCDAASAKRFVLQLNRPICLSCHTPIKGGTKNRHLFCTKTAKCRKAQNAYRYYKDRRGWSHEKALERALYSSTLTALLDRLTQKGG